MIFEEGKDLYNQKELTPVQKRILQWIDESENEQLKITFEHGVDYSTIEDLHSRLPDVITFIISQFSDEENEVEEVDYKLAGPVIYLTKKPIEYVSQ
jgi:hypothetical protein